MPCTQKLSDDGRFRYLGGACCLSLTSRARATRLALRAVMTLPQPLGYLGIDMILGERSDGSDDVVIEINPAPDDLLHWPACSDAR